MSEAASMAETRLYVCETCVRDRPVTAEEKTLGRQLADAIAERLRAADLPAGIVYRAVLCLNGCPRPCNVALRGPGKYSLRLGRLTLADVGPIVEFLREYSASPDGDVPPERWPAELREKLTVRTPPLGRAAGAAVI